MHDQQQHGVRRAHAAEWPDVADIYLTSRRSAGAAIPPAVHSDDEVRAYVRDVVMADHEVWFAVDAGGAAVGILVLAGQEIEWLYVRPGSQGRGAGSRLLEHAKTLRPDGLGLWVFASNDRAITFYERHSFLAVGSTDGDNEEGFPDVRYAFRRAR